MTDTPESRILIEGLKPADVALIKGVASEAADQAVNKMMIAMGLDPSRPFEAQADMQFLRQTRVRCESGGWQAILLFLGLLIGGAATAFWAGFKTLVK